MLFALFATSMRFSISRWLCIHIFTPEVNYNNKHPSYCTNMLIMLHWCPSQVGCNLGPCIYTHLSLAPNLNYFKGMWSPKGSLLSCASQVILQYKPLQVLEWPADVPNSYILPGSRRRLKFASKNQFWNAVTSIKGIILGLFTICKIKKMYSTHAN